MATSGLDSILNNRTELVRKGLRGMVLVGPSTASVINPTTLFDASSGDLKPAGIPAGYVGLGVLTDAGASAKEAVTSSYLQGWGYTSPVRSDIATDIDTLVVEPMETRAEVIGLYTGTDPTAYVYGTNGVLTIMAPTVRAQLRYRVLLLSVDVNSSGELVLGRFYPSMQMTVPGDQVFANGNAATTWPVTLTAYVDSTFGAAKQYLFGGAGWLAGAGDTEVPRIVTCTTATNTALVATTGVFSLFDQGRIVSGAGIVAGTKILTFTDTTHVVLDTATTATATGVAVTIS